MSDLTETERRILSTLGEGSGYTIGCVSANIDHAQWNTGDRRKISASIRKTLNAMRDRGLVAHLDGLKPVCWVRTRAGTEALKKEEANV